MFLNTKKNLTLSFIFLLSTITLLFGQNIQASLAHLAGLVESREWSAARASRTIAPPYTLSFKSELPNSEDEFVESSRVAHDDNSVFLATSNRSANTSGLVSFNKTGKLLWHTDALEGGVISNPLINKDTGLIYTNSPKGLSIFDKKGIVNRENSCYDTGIPDNSPSFDNDGNILSLNPFGTAGRLIDICSPDGTLKASYLIPSLAPTTTPTTTITSLTPTITPSEQTALLNLSNQDTTAHSQFTSDPLPEWKYKKALLINNLENIQTLTDYQVSLTLDTRPLITQEKMSKDCADMRFLDSDGITILPYWIETGCNTQSTKVWIKVPTIPASSTKSISLYYGNEGATETSSKGDTFVREIGDGANIELSLAYNFEDTRVSFLFDSSGNENHSRITVNVTSAMGKFGNAIDMDPDFGTNAGTVWYSLQHLNSFSYEVWVYPRKALTGSFSNIIIYPGQGCVPPTECTTSGLEVGNNGILVFEQTPGGILPTIINYPYPLTGWQHIVLTYQNGYAKLYLNGVLVGSGKGSYSSVYSSQHGLGHFRLGTVPYSGRTDALVDNYRLFKGALTQDEIADMASNITYATPNNKGKILVRKHSSPEPTTQIYGVGEIVIDQNNIAYANLYTTGFTAMRSTDGTMVWNNPSVSGRSVVALSPDEKTVYAVGNGDTLYALDTTDGHELWHTIIGLDDPALTVHPMTGTIYVSHAKDTTGNADTSMIYALTPGEGSLLWKYQTKAEITGVSFGLNENGALYFLDPESGMITALDTEKGALLWSYASDARNNHEITSDPETGAIYISAHQTLYGLVPWITEVRAKQDKRSIHFTVETTMLQRDPSASQDNLVQIKLTSPKAVTIPLSYTKEEDGKTYWQGSYMPPKNTNTKNTTYEGTVEEASYKTTTTQQTHFEKLPDGFENRGVVTEFEFDF